MKKPRHIRCAFALTTGMAALAFPFGAVQAVDTQIRTDNTLSGITPLNVDAPVTGTTYQITEANGKTAGNNLFYSFSVFNVGGENLSTFDTAHFDLHSANLANVVSRVSGGLESVIDGGLKMTNAGSSPAFFFINPAGITFGTNSVVDVPGSFYASTAGYLQFADGYRYNADGSGSNTLSSAGPESFGFLGDESGAINIGDGDPANALLTFQPGTEAAFVANSIVIDHASIRSTEMIDTGTMTTPGIDLQLIATGTEAANIKLDALPSEATGGDISLQTAYINVSGNGSGSIAIRAGDVTASGSIMSADNQGDLSMTAGDGIDMHVKSLSADNSWWTTEVYAAGNGADLNVTVDESLLLANGSAFSSEGFGGSGGAGSITVHAGQLTIDGFGNEGSQTPTGITSQTQPESIIDAGDLSIEVDGDLTIVNGGRISSSTAGTGDAGTISVNAGNLVIDGQGYGNFNTGITSNALPGSSGDAGSVTVTANTLDIADGGVISTSTAGSGDAGTVAIDAGQLTIDGNGSGGTQLFTGIASQAETGSGGTAGSVTVAADTLDIYNGGSISSSTYAIGDAGTVTVEVGQLQIDGQGYQGFSGITSRAEAGSSGDAGSVVVTANCDLSIAGGGSIETSTYGLGKAGNIVVAADTLTVQGTANIPIDSLGRYYAIDGVNPTGIFSIAAAGSGGQSGTIAITAGREIVLRDGAQISISNEATVADPGLLQPTFISIDAPSLSLAGSQIVADAAGNVDAGNITISFENSLNLDPSAISTVANDGNGGDITIDGGGGIIYLRDSAITTSVLGATGNGGDIDIGAGFLILDSGFVQANTAAEGASGGLVNIAVDALIPSGGLLFFGGDIPFSFLPYSGINVIQAAAPGGVSGTLNVTSPQLNLSGTLANLTIPSIDQSVLNHDICKIGQGSSLTHTGKGGLRRRAKDALTTARF